MQNLPGLMSAKAFPFSNRAEPEPERQSARAPERPGKGGRCTKGLRQLNIHSLPVLQFNLLLFTLCIPSPPNFLNLPGKQTLKNAQSRL